MLILPSSEAVAHAVNMVTVPLGGAEHLVDVYDDYEAIDTLGTLVFEGAELTREQRLRLFACRAWCPEVIGIIQRSKTPAIERAMRCAEHRARLRELEDSLDTPAYGARGNAWAKTQAALDRAAESEDEDVGHRADDRDLRRARRYRQRERERIAS